MSDISNIKWNAMSDMAIMKVIGAFVKHHRLEQNITQEQMAETVGINRATLSLFENGESNNLITLIQLLRALNLLPMLEPFLVTRQVSPLQLARLERTKRLKARRTHKKENNNKSGW